MRSRGLRSIYDCIKGKKIRAADDRLNFRYRMPNFGSFSTIDNDNRPLRQLVFKSQLLDQMMLIIVPFR